MFNYQGNLFSLIERYNYDFHRQDIVAGKIFSIENHGALVDIGAEKLAYLPESEIASFEAQLKHFVSQVREFMIISFNKTLKQFILSIKHVDYIRTWERIKQLLKEDVFIYYEVIGSNKAGAIVKAEALKGFIPSSHLSAEDNANKLKGNILPLKVLQADEDQNRLIFSYRCAILAGNKKIFQVGNILKGEIVSIRAYGVFIKVANLIGLLHISEVRSVLI